MKEKDKILVLIVTFSAEDWVDYSIKSLRVHLGEITILVVDNASTDGTVKKIKDQYPEVVLIKSEENLGFGRANNIGFKYAIENGFDYVFLLNQDAFIFPDTIEKLINIHKYDSKFGVVSPIHLNGTGLNLDYNFKKYISKVYGLGISYDEIIRDYNTDLPSEVQFVNAAAWLISRDCLINVGGFDPLFPHYGEDDDYVRRVWAKGYKLGVCSNAFIKHNRNQTETMIYASPKRMYINCLVSLKSSSKNMFRDYLWLMLYLGRSSVKYMSKLNCKLAIVNLQVAISLLSSYKKVKTSKIIENVKELAYLK